MYATPLNTRPPIPQNKNTKNDREAVLLYGAVGAVNLAVKDAGKNAGYVCFVVFVLVLLLYVCM